jgi:hypothetical protein
MRAAAATVTGALVSVCLRLRSLPWRRSALLAIAGRLAHIASVQRSLGVVALTAAAYIVPVLASRAEAAPRIAVVSAGACPARDAVLAALAQAMPDASIVADAATAPSDAEPVVVLSDDSASYHTVVRGVLRTLVDAPANCEERARKVAIVAALTLGPLQNPARPPEPGAAPAASTAVVMHARPDADIGVRFEIGPFADFAHIAGYRVTPVGSTARLTIDRGALGLLAGVSLSTWNATDRDDALYEQRIPIDAMVQLRGREGRLAGAVAFGPSLVFQRTKEGRDQATEIEADFRLLGRIEAWFTSGAGAYASVATTYVPTPAPLLDQKNLTYSMPHWWIAASVGLVLQIR